MVTVLYEYVVWIFYGLCNLKFLTNECNKNFVNNHITAQSYTQLAYTCVLRNAVICRQGLKVLL